MRSLSTCLFCPRPTWSGKPEKNPDDRHCVYHSPERRRNTNRLRARAESRRGPNHRPVGRVALPLACMFKPYERTRDGRVLFLGGICGARAPRRPNGEPKHPSRFGDPLCPRHAHLANDRFVFAPDLVQHVELVRAEDRVPTTVSAVAPEPAPNRSTRELVELVERRHKHLYLRSWERTYRDAEDVDKTDGSAKNILPETTGRHRPRSPERVAILVGLRELEDLHDGLLYMAFSARGRRDRFLASEDGLGWMPWRLSAIEALARTHRHWKRLHARDCRAEVGALNAYVRGERYLGRTLVRADLHPVLRSRVASRTEDQAEERRRAEAELRKLDARLGPKVAAKMRAAGERTRRAS